MNRTVRIALIIIALVAVGGGAAAIYLWNKPHRDLTAMEADFTVTPEALFTAFEANEADANAKYLNKVVEVKGTVMDKQEAGEERAIIMLEVPGQMFGLNCAFEADGAGATESVAVGDEVTLRGEVTGYTMDVNLARCVVMQ